MAVFPEQMDRLDLNDTTGCLQQIEDYIRYMTERMEFYTSNNTKLFSETGTTNASVVKILLTVSDRVSAVESNITNVINTTTTLASSVSKMQESVESMLAEIEELKTRVETLEGGTEA